MNKVLVTGGSGFIGSNLVDYLIKKDYEVWNLSKHTYATNPLILKHLDMNPRYHFLPLDVFDGEALLSTLQDIQVDYIFHLAAETHVDRSFIYPRDFLETNLVGTFNILESIRYLKNRPRILYMSTDEVFGYVGSGYCKETDLIRPRNPYSASKCSAEAYLTAYHYSFGLDTIISRSMNNYGPRQHPEKLIAKIITRCLKDQPFSLYKGDSIRGWVYVLDTCRALEYLMKNGQAGEIYHIPAYDYLSVSEVVNVITSILGKEEYFQGYSGRRLKDDERYALEGSKLKSLGWHPSISFPEGIRKTINWYSKNKWFWMDIYSP